MQVDLVHLPFPWRFGIVTKTFASFAFVVTASALAPSLASAQSLTAIRERLAHSISSGPKNEIIAGQILVQLDNRVAADLDAAQASEPGRPRPIVADVPSALAEYKFHSRIASTGWTLWQIPIVLDSEKLSNRLRKQPGILFAQPVHRIYPLLADPTDGDFNYQETDETYVLNFGEDPVSFRRLWTIDDTNAWAAWSQYPNTWYTSATKRPTCPLIAIIDTGCDMDHPDFANQGSTSTDSRNGGQIDKRLSAQFQFGAQVKVKPSMQDTNGHGTHVAGLAVAAGNNANLNGHSMIGLGYNSRAMILRVFDDTGNGSDADAAAAMFYAADKGADVISLSLGTTSFSQIFQDATTYAWQKGSLVVAAGNEDGSGGGNLGPIYPAACSGALAVSANGPNGQPATGTYSGYGPYVDLAAPGGDLVQTSDYYLIQFPYSTAVRGPSDLSNSDALYPPYLPEYTYLAGTSMACPQVSGAAGLFLGYTGLRQSSGWANLQAYRSLERGAAGVMGAANGGWELKQGYGTLDAWSSTVQYDARASLIGACEGIVYRDSTAQSNIPVTAHNLSGGNDYSTTTRADGCYRFDLMTPGYYDVVVAPGGLEKRKRVFIRAGCDFTGLDFWGGTFIRDTTPPVASKLIVKSTEAAGINVEHWGYDAESTIDLITMQVGTTSGGSNILAPTQVVIDTNQVHLNTAALTNGTTYYLTATYTNGKGQTTSKTVSFVRTVPAMDASFVSSTIPATFKVGRPTTITLTFKNTGTASWDNSKRVLIQAQDPLFAEQFGLASVRLPAGSKVAPGQSFTFSTRLKALRKGMWDLHYQPYSLNKPFGGPSQNGFVLCK
jgi:Subtilase family